MSQVIKLDAIKEALATINGIQLMEEGFAAYSNGKVVVPPVGELTFEDPPGDVHLKYGYIKQDDYYVIKIASGFYNNPQINLPSSNGLMLLFDQKNGQLKAVLLDEGYLTDIRTALAGAVVAKYMAPKNVSRIGIVGTGIQGKLQLEFLRSICPCRNVLVHARSEAKGQAYIDHFAGTGFNVAYTLNVNDIPQQCNLIVTTTPSTIPLIKAEFVQPGTHITAMGSDTGDKIEVDPKVLGRADIVVSDSIPQSETRGEVFQAVKAGILDKSSVKELGQVINQPELGRQNDDQITVADLTGVAVQDIQITKAVYESINA
jgi:ornithine cyclodeaminase